MNIYAEISIENLEKEYKKNITEILDYDVNYGDSLIYHNHYSDDYRKYLRSRLLNKNKLIKD